MADQTIELQLKTLAELKGINDTLSGLKKIQTESKGAQDGLNSVFGSFGKSFSGIPKLLGGIAAGFLSVRAAASFLGDSLNEANSAEKSLNGLKLALSSTGEVTDSTIRSVQEFASALQDVSRFGDDVIIDQVSIAKNFGLTTSEAKNLVSVAADLAAVSGSDLNSATETLLKSLTGQLPRELKLLGVDFANLTEQQLRSAGAITLVQSKFTGRAAADIATVSGAVEQLKNSFSDLQQSIGEFLVKVVDLPSALKGVNFIIKRIIGDSSELAKVTQALRDVNEEIERSKTSPLFTTAEVKDLVSKRETLSAQLKTLKEDIDSAKKASEKPLNSQVLDFKVDEKSRDDFLRSIKNTGLTAIEIAKKDKEELLRLAKDRFGGETNLAKLDVENRKLYADAKLRIEKDFNDKVLAGQKKVSKEQIDEAQKTLREFQDAKSNPGFALGKILTGKASDTEKQGFALGVSTAAVQDPRNLIGIGAEGVGTAIGGTIGGQVGAAIGPVLQELSKGKDAAKAFVTEFLNSIPDMILGLIDGIAAAGVAFVEQVPKIIEKFVQGLPAVIESLVNAMPEVAVALSIQMPQVAATFALSLIDQAPNIAEAIIKAVGNAPGNAVKGLGKVFKFADGGQFVKSVPSGFGSGSSERFPAILGSGELVVDRSTAFQLKDFLQSNSKGPRRQDPEEQGDMMAAIMALANRPVVVTIDGREIAKSVRSQVRSGLVLA